MIYWFRYFKKESWFIELPFIEDIKERVKIQLNMFHEGIKRFVNPHNYPVGLEKGLYDFKTEVILKLRSKKENNTSKS